MNATLPPQVALELQRTLGVPARPLLTRGGWGMFALEGRSAEAN